MKPMQCQEKCQKLQFLEWAIEVRSKSESILIRPLIKMPHLTSEHVYNMVQKTALASKANFPVHDNCILISFIERTCFNYIKA